MSINEIASLAAKGIGCDPVATWALARVESGGGKHLHRYEKHVFKRLTGRSARSYTKARQIDPEAAAAASSWGAFQVMGHWYQDLGYKDAIQMAEALFYAENTKAQAQSVVDYCTVTSPGSGSALRSLDAEKLALLYNGPRGVQNGYHIKYREALAAAGRHSAVTLSAGDTGVSVRVLQERLVELGHGVKIDGHFGRKTEQAVMAVQRAKGLKADGIVGAKTWGALGGREKVVTTNPPPGLDEQAEVIIADNPVKTVGTVLGAGWLAVRSTLEGLQSAAMQFGISPSEAIEAMAPHWPTIRIAVLLSIAALALWIIMKDRQNDKRDRAEGRAFDPDYRSDGDSDRRVPDSDTGNDALVADDPDAGRQHIGSGGSGDGNRTPEPDGGDGFRWKAPVGNRGAVYGAGEADAKPLAIFRFGAGSG